MVFKGRKVGIAVGIICGLLVDSMYANIIGVYAIMFMLIGYANGSFGKIFNRSDRVVPIVLIGFSQLLILFYIMLLTFVTWQTKYLLLFYHYCFARNRIYYNNLHHCL